MNNIQKIIDQITEFILNFDIEDLGGPVKIITIIFAAIVAAIILFGVAFSHIPQF